MMHECHLPCHNSKKFYKIAAAIQSAIYSLYLYAKKMIIMTKIEYK